MSSATKAELSFASLPSCDGPCASGHAPANRSTNGAGFPYFNPHSFRSTIVAVGRQVCGNSCERMQAWAENLGHESLTTTFGSYGKAGAHEQGALVRGKGPDAADSKLDRLMAMVERIQPR